MWQCHVNYHVRQFVRDCSKRCKTISQIKKKKEKRRRRRGSWLGFDLRFFTNQ
jgi:hypothetical protein